MAAWPRRLYSARSLPKLSRDALNGISRRALRRLASEVMWPLWTGPPPCPGSRAGAETHGEYLPMPPRWCRGGQLETAVVWSCSMGRGGLQRHRPSAGGTPLRREVTVERAGDHCGGIGRHRWRPSRRYGATGRNKIVILHPHGRSETAAAADDNRDSANVQPGHRGTFDDSRSP